jgi:hypothetical protein
MKKEVFLLMKNHLVEDGKVGLGRVALDPSQVIKGIR